MKKFYSHYSLPVIAFALVFISTSFPSIRGLLSLLSTPVLTSAEKATRSERAGKDGALSVTTPGKVVNLYATLAANAPAGSARLSLNYPDSPYGMRPDSLTAGDLLLIVQMAGATIDNSDTSNYGQVTSLNSAGRYEFITLSKVEGGMVTVKPPCGGLLNNYIAEAQVQVIRVPQYSSMTIASGASLSAPAWNGSFGGIVAVHVADEAVIDGNIDVSGIGFRGGALSGAGGGLNRSDYVTRQQDYGAEKGEGIAGYQSTYDRQGGRFARGAAANGGGGGTSHNSGGGGGANGSNGSAWNGQGVMDGSVTGAEAWKMDPAYIGGGNRLTSSSGGGRGGYSFADTDRNALQLGPDQGEWGGDRRRSVGGLGGRPLTQDPTERILMGGGGGAGAQNNGSGGAGGNAGGLIYLIAGRVSGQGHLKSNGNAGHDTQRENRDGAGGGGAGGTIVIYASTLSGIRAEARGGNGGDQNGPVLPNIAESQGPGGGGGGGYIAFRGGLIGTDVSGGINGVTRAVAMAEFPANGATSGASGVAVPEIGVIPFCQTTADIAVKKSNGSNFIVPGLPTTYTIEVSNTGPNNIYGVDVVDRLPVGFVESSKIWSCQATAGSSCAVVSGTGDVLTTVDLLNQGRVTLTVTAVMAATATGSVSNTVEVTPPAGGTDPVLDNNRATDTDLLTPLADLAIGISSGGRDLVPGMGVGYVIDIVNNGPSDAIGFNILDQIPGTVSVEEVTCTASGAASCGANLSSGNGVGFGGAAIATGAGNAIRILVNGRIASSANGRLINTASIVLPAGASFTDPDIATNTATDNAPLTPQANLVITKTNNQSSVIAGSSVNYEIEVINLGPSDASTFDISDEIPQSMSMSSLTCSSTGGDCGMQRTLSHQIELIGASLPAGGGRSIRMTFGGPVSSTASGRLISVASIQIPVGVNLVDPEPESNIASDNDPLVAEADLAIVKTVSSSNILAGGQISYRIEVTNNGPSGVVGATVSDVLPAGLSNGAWSCQATAGSKCGQSSGSGNIEATVDLAVGGRAIFTLLATIAPDYSGSVVNTANVIPPVDLNDQTMGNNSSTTRTVVGRNADLEISKTSAVTSVRAGEQLSYTLTITNRGVSEAEDVVITDPLPAGLELISITPSRGSCTGTTSIVNCTIGRVGVNAENSTASLVVTVRVPLNFPLGVMTNTGSVSSATADPNPGNNSASYSVRVTDAPRPNFDAIVVSNNNPSFCLGSDKIVTVAARIINTGDGYQRDNPGAEFTAQLPVEMIGMIGTCSASTGHCLMSSNQVEWNGQLAPGEVLNITYQIRIRSGLNSGARFCTRFRMNYDRDNDGFNESFISRDDCQITNCRETVTCSGQNCALSGPGVPLSNVADPISSDMRPGSILIFPYYTSSSTNTGNHNTRISITNSDSGNPVFVHLFFVNGRDGIIADSFICLTANQTTGFLLSDLDPDVNGYLIAVAVNGNGCPIKFNALIGESAIRTSEGFSATVAAEAVAALTSPACNPAGVLTTINLDGVQYSLLGRTLAVNSIASPANGDATMLIINPIGGNMTEEAIQLGKISGLIFNDVEQGFSFTTTEGVQMAQQLTASYPRSAPRLPAIIPGGRSGWMRLSAQDNTFALVGLRMSRNLNPRSFNGGSNLHKLTVGPTSLTIPVIVPTCQ